MYYSKLSFEGVHLDHFFSTVSINSCDANISKRKQIQPLLRIILLPCTFFSNFVKYRSIISATELK